MNRIENDPKFWQSVASNLEWSRGSVPMLAKAIFDNAVNSERLDQWKWIQRAKHYADTGRLLDDEGSESGLVDIPAPAKARK